MIYAAMGIQFFEGDEEWAKGNAVWVKQNTEALAQQAALVSVGGLDDLTSWFGAFRVLEDGSLELVTAWHLADDGVQEGLPDTIDEPTPPSDEDATPPGDEDATPPSDEDPEPTYDPWTQPEGGHDAYNTGDIVAHNGQLWASTIDGNVWEPGVHGWEVYNP